MGVISVLSMSMATPGRMGVGGMRERVREGVRGKLEGGGRTCVSDAVLLALHCLDDLATDPLLEYFQLGEGVEAGLHRDRVGSPTRVSKKNAFFHPYPHPQRNLGGDEPADDHKLARQVFWRFGFVAWCGKGSEARFLAAGGGLPSHLVPGGRRAPRG
jgi:hypothetical protein